MRIIVPLLALLLVPACQKQPEEPAAETSATPAATADALPSASPTHVSTGARDVDEETALYTFEYSYPWAVGTIPALKARLDADIDKQRGELAAMAKDASDDAVKNDFPFRKHSRSIGWKVVTDLPDWLSLSATIGTYEGGAHPNHWFNALLWDRKADAERQALDLFTSKEELSGAIRQDFCAAIDRQRAKKRGEPVQRDSGDLFTECLDPIAYTVILGSSNSRTFDRIGILVPPYEAGPYVEGDYEVTLPVTAKVLGLVRPEHRASFSTGR